MKPFDNNGESIQFEMIIIIVLLIHLEKIIMLIIYFSKTPSNELRLPRNFEWFHSSHSVANPQNPFGCSGGGSGPCKASCPGLEM